jgi:hypothetical protein
MNDEWEDAQNDFIDSLYADFSQEVLEGRSDLHGLVIAQFVSERLHSYYLQTPQIVDRSRWALLQAKALIADHPEASLIMAVTAAEVGLKSGLLKPILHGLVHDDAMAAVVAELVPEQRNNRFKDLLFGILREYGGVDLQTFRRDAVVKTLWQEIEEIQKARNQVLHRATAAAREDAERAVAIAEIILLNLYPAVLRKIGLSTLAYEASLLPQGSV